MILSSMISPRFAGWLLRKYDKRNNMLILLSIIYQRIDFPARRRRQCFVMNNIRNKINYQLTAVFIHNYVTRISKQVAGADLTYNNYTDCVLVVHTHTAL